MKTMDANLGLGGTGGQSPMAMAGAAQGGLLANQVNSQTQQPPQFTQQSYLSGGHVPLIFQGARPFNGGYGSFQYGSGSPGGATVLPAAGQIGAGGYGTAHAGTPQQRQWESDLRQYLAMGGNDPLGIYSGYYTPERAQAAQAFYQSNQP